MSSLASPGSTEDLVLSMWRRALGPKARQASGRILEVSVGLQRVLRFLEDIEKTLGVAVRPTMAIQLGSTQALANAIDSDIWPEPSSLVLMRDGDDSEILYIVSAGSGVVLELCDLAQLITFPGKIYGLQLPGLAGEAEPLTSIGAMAEHYKDAIIAHAPTKRVHVLGYSFGGLVAHELARSLKSANHPTGLIGILDSSSYEKFWPKTEWLRAAVKRIRRKLEITDKPKSVVGMVSFMGHSAKTAWKYLQRRLRKTVDVSQAAQSVYYIGGLDEHFQNVRNACIVAYESYDPSAYDGKTVLFKSEFGDPNACNPLAIWKRKIAQLEVVHVSGTHVTMIRKPFVETLADKISTCLKA